MEHELNRVVDALPGLVWTTRPDGYCDFLNQRWCDYTGLTPEAAFGWGWQAAIHAEDRPGMLEGWRAIIASCQTGEVEARLRRHDGEYRWFLFRACPLTDATGKVVKWCGISTDIEDRKRVEETLRDRERDLAGEKRLLEMVAGGRPLSQILTELCHLVERSARGCYCSIVLVDPTGSRLERGVAPSLPPSFINAIDGRPVSVDSGPCAMAAQLNQQVVATDLAAETRWASHAWCPMAISHGLRSCWSTPISSTTGKVLGAFAIYYDQPKAPTPLDQGLIEQFTHIASIAIERTRNEDERRQAEALLAGEKRLLEMVAWGYSLPVVLDAMCRIVEQIATGSYCSVVLLDPSATHLRYAAAPTLPEGFVQATHDGRATPDAGPCAMAACLNQQVIVSDISAEERWGDYQWRPSALSSGLRACWSTPIRSTSGNVLGTFALLFGEPGTPTALHHNLIDQFTHIASIAIERTRGEEALKRSEALLAEAQRLSSTGSFSWRVETDDVTLSEQTYRIYGFDLNQPVTLDLIATRIHPEDMPLMHQMVALARGPGSDLDYEYRLRMPDGTVKHLHLVARGTRDRNGELEYIGAIQDVTHRRLSEAALSKLRSELAHVARVTSLGALTASIAHEVNQPLSGIITNASTCLRMLGAEPPNVDGARETARRTIRDGHRAADVINRLRALFAKKGVATETVDLNEATREVIALSASELQRSRVVLRPELANDLPPVTGDRVQLQQVILNLLRNASDAMRGIEDRPRQLLIRTEREPTDGVRLTVQDAGVGLDPQMLDRLFDTFYTTKDDGMGIGLSVSRSIIESHNGRLWAAPNDGPGATFSFSIPRGLDRVIQTQEPAAGRAAASMGGQVVRDL